MPARVISFIKENMIDPLRVRIMTAISRAVLESIDDTQGIQLVKVSLMAGEVRDNIERMQNYGFTSFPKSGAECACLFVGGNREHGLVVSIDDRRFRLKSLAEGEVALYTDEGDRIHFKRGNEIEIKGATKVIVNSAAIELGDGVLEKILNGEQFRTLYNLHTHQGNLAIPTGPPIVQSPTTNLSTVVKAEV